MRDRAYRSCCQEIPFGLQLRDAAHQGEQFRCCRLVLAGLVGEFRLPLEKRLAGHDGDGVGQAALGCAVTQPLVERGQVDPGAAADVPRQWAAEDRPEF